MSSSSARPAPARSRSWPPTFRLVEAVIALAYGRLLIGFVTGETAGTAFVPLVDWRWAFAVPIAALLVCMVEIVVNPEVFE